VTALVCIALPVAFAGLGDYEDLKGCALPKLFLAGSEDDICPPPKLRELVGSLPDPKFLVVLDGTDHFFRDRESDLATHLLAFLAPFRPGA
jgi:alpha/beta superfamily hydrolase